VHTFLLRHVYSSTLNTGKVSRTSATFLTFLLSALCHELVMAVVSKKIRAYLFGMQMAQLPMIGELLHSPVSAFRSIRAWRPARGALGFETDESLIPHPYVVSAVAMGRMPIVKRNKALGNVVFWLGLMSGFPLLAIAYVSDTPSFSAGFYLFSLLTSAICLSLPSLCTRSCSLE
jgi:sterol O-acyltransferase